MTTAKLLPLLAVLVAPPAVAHVDPAFTVEMIQRELDGFFAEGHDGITVTNYRDDTVKTSLLVRNVGASRTPRRCVTEFSTPSAVIEANAKSEKVWRIDWSAIAEVRLYEQVKIELVPKKPDPVRVFIEIPGEDTARDFADAFDFLRKNCSA